MRTCHDNLERSSTEKHLCIHLLLIHCLQIVYLTQRSCTQQKISLIVTKINKDCMERFCKDLREHAMKIINYGKKK